MPRADRLGNDLGKTEEVSWSDFTFSLHDNEDGRDDDGVDAAAEHAVGDDWKCLVDDHVAEDERGQE